MKQRFFTWLYYAAILVAIGSALYLGCYYYERYQSDQQIAKIQQLVRVEVESDDGITKATERKKNVTVPGQTTSPNSTPTSSQATTTKAVPLTKIDFDTLQTINPDAFGWITIADTKVDYPVVQKEDNDYYLNHNVFKKYDRQGAVFMDYRNTLTSQNIILYAHNMKNGSMFADVAKYKDPKQMKNHPVLSLLIDQDELLFEVIAAFYYDTKTETYLYHQVGFNEVQLQEYLTFVNARTLYEDITLSLSDQWMTLSTCNYDSNGDRFVVILKRQ